MNYYFAYYYFKIIYFFKYVFSTFLYCLTEQAIFLLVDTIKINLGYF